MRVQLPLHENYMHMYLHVDWFVPLSPGVIYINKVTITFPKSSMESLIPGAEFSCDLYSLPFLNQMINPLTSFYVIISKCYHGPSLVYLLDFFCLIGLTRPSFRLYKYLIFVQCYYYILYLKLSCKAFVVVVVVVVVVSHRCYI